MFHIIGVIFFGFIVGLIARLLVPGQNHMSLPITAVLGIVGSLLAGWFGRVVGWYGPDDGAGFIVSTLGAIVLLSVYHMIAKKRDQRRGPPKVEEQYTDRAA